MKIERLRVLNFQELVRYEGGAPTPQYRYDPPISCTGFCTSCEDSGLAPTPRSRLDLLSHGCDSSDYEAILGPLPPSELALGGRISEPILFLLESPGSDSENAVTVEAGRHQKSPPVRHYYWSPDPADGWPEDAESLPHYYGPYFAYLMRRFGLANVYITNAVKCGKKLLQQPQSFEPFGASDRNDRAIAENCYRQFLEVEVEEHKPQLFVAFGARAWQLLNHVSGAEAEQLWHPAARVNGSKFIAENNDILHRALASRGWLAA